MVCVSRTYHLEVKSKKIFANLHNEIKSKITVARTNNANLYVFMILGAR